jgi:hypothetical protein
MRTPHLICLAFLAAFPSMAVARTLSLPTGYYDTEIGHAYLGYCAAQNKGWTKRSVRLLKLGQLSKGEAKNLYFNIQSSRCFPMDHEFTAVDVRLFRSGFFAALYAQKYGQHEPSDLQAVPMLDFVSEFDVKDGNAFSDAIKNRKLGDCFARANSKLAHRIATSENGVDISQDPASQFCFEKNSMQLSKVRYFTLRGAVAEALYRLRKAERTYA